MECNWINVGLPLMPARWCCPSAQPPVGVATQGPGRGFGPSRWWLFSIRQNTFRGSHTVFDASKKNNADLTKAPSRFTRVCITSLRE